MPDVSSIPNPFAYGQALRPGRPFCPRPDLENALRQAAKSNQRLVLLGERRMGKSSLVEHTLDELTGGRSFDANQEVRLLLPFIDEAIR